MGPGRTRGFGSVSLHPGKANGLYRPQAKQRSKISDSARREAIQKAIEIARNPMPSSSQWSALRCERTQGVEQALNYLEKQMLRPSHIYAAWQDVEAKTREIIRMNDQAALAALTFLSHKAADRRGEN